MSTCQMGYTSDDPSPPTPFPRLEATVISTRVVCLLGSLLIFSQNLGAFSTGPPANRDGLSGIYCTACHITNPLNSGDGSVRIVGLPSAWLPGETYSLQVIVSHPTARRWG